MKNKLTRYEQETIINFNKEHDKVCIFTYEKSLIRAIKGKNLAESVTDNGYGGKDFVLPYGCLRIQFLKIRGKDKKIKKGEKGLVGASPSPVCRE